MGSGNYTKFNEVIGDADECGEPLKMITPEQLVVIMRNVELSLQLTPGRTINYGVEQRDRHIGQKILKMAASKAPQAFLDRFPEIENEPWANNLKRIAEEALKKRD